MLEAQLVKIKHNLNIIQRYKIQGQKIRARMNWINEGDKGLGYFFNVIKATHKSELIDEIQVDGRNSKEPEDIQKAFYQFYKDLFSLEMGYKEHSGMDECLRLIPVKVSAVEQVSLNKGLSIE